MFAAPASARHLQVVANILRGPLLELQPRLTAYCRPGGRLVLSGILTEQVCARVWHAAPAACDGTVTRTDDARAAPVHKKRTSLLLVCICIRVCLSQVPDVVEAYSSAFEGFQVTSEGSWALVTARRRGGGHGVAQLEP